LPLRFENVKSILETYGPEKFAAIVIVGPTYDGFSSPSEEKQIYDYAQSHGICVIIDGAWDAVRFRTKDQTKHTLSSTCDIWITSPHKRGLTPSSLGAVLTQNQTIARLWDEALDLGFRSSSVSFVEIMIAEHRLEQIQSGKWDRAFIQAEETAKHLRKKIQNVHRSLHVIEPNDLNAETGDPAHILISTHKIPNLDARMWAKTLSIHFGLDVEKATQSTLLLICASPAHANQLDKVTLILKDALTMTLNQESLEIC